MHQVTMSQFSRNVHSKRDLLFALEVKGKYPLRLFISYVGQIFLPEKRFCTLVFLKGIMSGRKAFFKNADLRPVNIPRYKSLSLKHVFEMAQCNPQISKYLPDQLGKTEPQVDRHFLFTIVNTCDTTFFSEQLERIDREKTEAAQKVREDVIEVQPEIMRLLESFGASATG